MTKPLWQLLLAEPSSLDCDECFTVIEHFAKLLARDGNALPPDVLKYLAGCPDCTIEHRMALRRLDATHPEKKTPATANVPEPKERGNT